MFLLCARRRKRGKKEEELAKEILNTVNQGIVHKFLLDFAQQCTNVMYGTSMDYFVQILISICLFLEEFRPTITPKTAQNRNSACRVDTMLTYLT